MNSADTLCADNEQQPFFSLKMMVIALTFAIPGKVIRALKIACRQATILLFRYHQHLTNKKISKINLHILAIYSIFLVVVCLQERKMRLVSI